MKEAKIINRGDVAEVQLYDVIGEDPWFGGGISAKTFRDQIKSIKAKTINLRVNSPGGSVTEGAAMLNTLDEFPGRIEVDIDGMSASAATFIMMAGDVIRAASNSLTMIHDAGQVDDILLKISQNRFVTVMGYSGSGKSSLMFCGMVPVLYGGFMTNSGPYWNVITARPGPSPIQGLVDSIVEFMISNHRIDHADIDIHKAIINSVLRSGSDGLIEISRYLQTDKEENIFFLIDQFEEIFRFRDQAFDADILNEAQLFVIILVSAVQQT